jgi:hypothetical protein
VRLWLSVRLDAVMKSRDVTYLYTPPHRLRAQVGIWKHHFSSKNVIYFNSLHSRLLKTLDYEQDYLSPMRM